MINSKKYTLLAWGYHILAILIIPLLIGITFGPWIAFAILFLNTLFLILFFVSSGKPGERRYFHFFGTTIRIAVSEDGLILKMPGITEVMFPAENIESYIPDKPENIFHGSEVEIIPSGMTRTLRITTNDTDDASDDIQTSEKGDDRTNDELRRSITLEPKFMIIWTILETEEGISDFVKKYRNSADAEYAIKQKTISIASELFGRKTPATLLENQKKCKEYVLSKIKDAFKGIEIIDFFILDFGLPKKVSEALSKVPEAQLEAKSSEITAAQEAKNTERTNLVTRTNTKENLAITREDVQKTGEIKAQNEALAIKLTLEAKAKGTKQLATELGIEEKELLLVLPALEKIAENPNLNLNLFSGGENDMISKLLTKFLTKKQN